MHTLSYDASRVLSSLVRRGAGVRALTGPVCIVATPRYVYVYLVECPNDVDGHFGLEAWLFEGAVSNGQETG